MKIYANAHCTIEIPSLDYRNEGFHIRVKTLPGYKKDTEVLKVIATKQKIDYTDEIVISGGFGLIGTPRTAMVKLMRWLSEIPVSERAEATVMYTVRNIE